MTSSRRRGTDRFVRVMNDPSFAFGTVWGPMVTVERSLVLLQTRLALVPEDRLTDDYLKAQYLAVLESLVEAGLLVVTSFTQPTIDEATWTVTSYLVANAIILPMTGWLASVFGRKRLLMLSVVGFTTSSFLCGLAPTLPSLIFFRVVQGATGGALHRHVASELRHGVRRHGRGNDCHNSLCGCTE